LTEIVCAFNKSPPPQPSNTNRTRLQYINSQLLHANVVLHKLSVEEYHHHARSLKASLATQSTPRWHDTSPTSHPSPKRDPWMVCMVEE